MDSHYLYFGVPPDKYSKYFIGKCLSYSRHFGKVKDDHLKQFYSGK